MVRRAASITEAARLLSGNGSAKPTSDPVRPAYAPGGLGVEVVQLLATNWNKGGHFVSTLGDLIVEHGPYEACALVPNAVMRFIESDQLNALRDDLIALTCLRELIPNWAELIEGDSDWHRGNIPAVMSEMRAWAEGSR